MTDTKKIEMLIFYFLTVLAICLLETTYVPFTGKDTSEKNSQIFRPTHQDWRTWKDVYAKEYSSGEAVMRLTIWLSNYKEVRAHNLRFEEGRESYLQELNGFSDARPWELHLPFAHFPRRNKKRKPVTLSNDVVPEYMNWAVKGWTSNLRSTHQLQNGWAFSVVEAIQSQMYNVTGRYKKLSVKEIIDCAGRFLRRPPTTVDAFDYILQNGLTLESHYGINLGIRGHCRRKVWHPNITIDSFHILEPNDEENLKLAVVLFGPISVSITITRKFLFYKTGIFYDPNGNFFNSQGANHAVLLVGYGTDNLGGDFWIIKNFWGLLWGEHGYARIARNTLVNCGIASFPIYPVL